MAESFEAAVIGGGPAGLSAATWLGRYRCRSLLIDAGEPRNRWTEEVHGYLGLDPISPKDLLDRSRTALKQYETIETLEDRIVSLSLEDGVFHLRSDGGRSFQALRVILATGVFDDFPGVQGFFTHYGADIFHCPDCDGFEARGRKVGVLGIANVEGLAAKLRNWAASVITVMPSGTTMDPEVQSRLEASNVAFVQGDARSFEGERNALQGIRLKSGELIECDLVFFMSRDSHVGSLARDLGCQVTDEGCIQVDHEGRTSIEGVYAAGDITPGEHLVQVAAAKGTMAGIACARSLRSRN